MYPILVKEAKADERIETLRGGLEGRFGALSGEFIQALKAADEATLKGVISHAGTDTLEQIRERLGLSAGQG
ncbi:MAG TPA: hypothetical protein VH599_00855 [Ktedonobacterales bacterium]